MRDFSYIIFLILACLVGAVAQHPVLGLTREGVDHVRKNLNKYPLFYSEFQEIKSKLDTAIKEGIDVPVPKDMAGGYSHETHKNNYKLLQQAGNLYQITEDEIYAEFVKTSLMRYAEVYKSTGLHPARKSYARGKFFWQCLNDSNWIVFVSQAYDCIYDYLTISDRKHLEEEFLIPYCNHISQDNPRFFNRIHNHSTWANAAVGMMALAMENDTLLQKALYGLNNDNISSDEVDNDGAYIKKEGIQESGFLAQLDYSFSPDGYFSEGPYYQRYAIFPFLVFSYALHNARPDLDIFNYNDEILKKATYSLLNLTNSKGEFFAINDAQKGMAYTAYELITAVNLIYAVDSSQKSLLSWAKLQNAVMLNQAGYEVAKALTESNIDFPSKHSQAFTDGSDGSEGGIAVLRMQDTELLFKYSAQGMGHGHFDRLSYSIHDSHGELVQDYGAVRWVNVDQKGGGRYLPENKTFGKQTVGHNALVVDGTSHYNGSVKQAELHHPVLNYFDASDPNIQVISASDHHAYNGVEMTRTLMLIKDSEFVRPLVLDLLVASSDYAHTYDLPLWYTGHFMKSNLECTTSLDELKPMGMDNGYEHIWKLSHCKADGDMHSFNWLTNNRFYTHYTTLEAEDSIILGRAGANDPNFNLRSDPVLLFRSKGIKEKIFLSLLESHGHYSRVTEVPIDPYGSIIGLKLVEHKEDYTILSFDNDSYRWLIYYSSNPDSGIEQQTIEIDGLEYIFNKKYQIIKQKK